MPDTPFYGFYACLSFSMGFKHIYPIFLGFISFIPLLGFIPLSLGFYSPLTPFSKGFMPFFHFLWVLCPIPHFMGFMPVLSFSMGLWAYLPHFYGFHAIYSFYMVYSTVWVFIFHKPHFLRVSCLFSHFL